MSDAAKRAALLHQMKWTGLDSDKSHEIYHDDAVLERIYVTERFDAAEWRSEWAEMFDPFESFTPEEQRENASTN